MKYEQVEEGEWVQPKARGYRQACCDCGLVHIWDFRIVNGVLEYRVRRNDRATAAVRRGLKKKLEDEQKGNK